MAAEKPVSRGQAWFCTTGLPTDVVVEVGEMCFHLHKFPLMSKSRKLHQLITENNGAEREEDEIEEVEEDFQRIQLPDFPGGAEIFEVTAKFCYGVKIEITAWNVAALRCAAEYLEMTEELAEENLVARTERFLSQLVLRSLKESVKVLKSCEDLLPVAEDLGLVQRCVDSIANRASASTDLRTLFSRTVTDGSHRRADTKLPHAAIAALWNGIESGIRRKSGLRSSAAAAADADSWLEDLATISLPMYKRVISAMKEKDLCAEVIEGSLMSYAQRSIPGLLRTNRHENNYNATATTAGPLPSEAEQKELLETVITNLPQSSETKIRSPSSRKLTIRFLFGLLRAANILRASEASRIAVERRIASQLEHATVDDLLMPSYTYLVETLYDVDCVERVVRYFLEELEGRAAVTDTSNEHAADEDDVEREGSTPCNDRSKLVMAGKLMDAYLSEIASDANLKADRFCDLARALPDHARVFDDGLYRAIDAYLKDHPRITDEEKERVCGVMDCQKLTLEACTHAAQNERLPLRTVVQVLFSEQQQLRRAIAGTLMTVEEEREEDAAAAAAAGAGRENQVLRLDMNSMRSRVQGLERECSRMRKAIERMNRGPAPVVGIRRGRLAQRLSCKFGSQVCVSHQRTVVAPRKSGMRGGD